MSKQKTLFTLGGSAFVLAIGIVAATNLITNALTPSGGFALQVSPSPLVATVKPGTTTNLELNIRNQGSDTENLKIDLRKFAIDKQSGAVNLADETPVGITDWVSFSRPSFTLESGKTLTEKVRISLPQDTGFSYSFALLISRANGDTLTSPGASIHGSVAVFTLINVDRPGAVRKFEITDFKPSMPIFEYLPADFKVTFKNTGNTIVQPYGNIFIQRGSNDGLPISTLPLNDQHGYLLPGSPRTLTSTWNDGFPVYKTTIGVDGKQKKDLAWDLSKLIDFRFGQYTAKLIAIYNDGQRDVPVASEVTFWVIPWRALLILIVVIAIVLYLFRIVIRRRTQYAMKHTHSDGDKIKVKVKTQNKSTDE
jgi:hypothetical protein